MSNLISILLVCAMVIGIAVLSMIPDMPVVFWIDKGDHVVAFGCLSAMLFIATRRPVASFILASAAAALVEIAQGAFPSLNRECSIADLMTGVAAAGVGALACGLASRIARRQGVRRRDGSS